MTKKTVVLIQVLFFSFFGIVFSKIDPGLINSGHILSETDFVYHVALKMNDGTAKNGYIVWNKKSLDGFLTYCKSRTARFQRFNFFSTCYTVNDGGIAGGLALSLEDRALIWPDSVKRIQFLPDQLEGPTKKHAYYLTKAEIKIMQNTLIFKEIGEDGPCELLYFNYNPIVSRKGLHNYALEFEKLSGGGISKPEWHIFCEKLKNKKIVYVTLWCGEND